MEYHNEILTSINSLGGVKGFKKTTKKDNPWNVAFDLYNSDGNTKTLRSLNCESCRIIIYKWLNNKAKK